ncbi:hypothetical protein HYFRA_00010009 [Hymenoscyphus fraxineus]|uniref:Uncharacterized protein n=1 Tax=Hymenoscyphus fraxineus TaxID=746836 RepID=A0A9N9KX12_9HELO|nr:hypothetical protein HYFRA_00010009 [Hymenoscyphus fraxineus]
MLKVLNEGCEVYESEFAKIKHATCNEQEKLTRHTTSFPLYQPPPMEQIREAPLENMTTFTG